MTSHHNVYLIDFLRHLLVHVESSMTDGDENIDGRLGPLDSLNGVTHGLYDVMKHEISGRFYNRTMNLTRMRRRVDHIQTGQLTSAGQDRSVSGRVANDGYPSTIDLLDYVFLITAQPRLIAVVYVGAEHVKRYVGDKLL